MSFLAELLENIRTAAEAALTPEPTPPAPATRDADPDPAPTPTPSVSIVYGSDPPMNGICMIQGAGFPSEEHLNAGMLYRLPVLLNGKNASQEQILDDLTTIHVALTKTLDYTALRTESVQVLNIRTTASPSILGREQNNQWICGSSFEVSFYWR